MLEPDAAVFRIAQAFSSVYVDVKIVCDHPSKRHPSKRATCKRKGDAEKGDIKLVIARAVLHSLMTNGQDDGSSSERAASIHDKQKEIRSLEKTSKRRLPSDFTTKLEKSIAGFNSEGKGEIEMEIAPTQADPCLAQRL